MAQATVIKYLLFACILLASMSFVLFVAAQWLDDMARLPTLELGDGATFAPHNNVSANVSVPDLTVQYKRLGVYYICDGSGGNCGSYSDAVCEEVEDHSGEVNVCTVRHSSAAFMILGCISNLVIVFSIMSLFTRRFACCSTRHIGPSLFLGLLTSVTSGVIAMSVYSSAMRNYGSDAGSMVAGRSLMMLSIAWAFSVINIVMVRTHC